jgi:hypothetical protein
MVMVLNLGCVYSRFLTKDFVDTDVLIFGPNFTGVVVFLKSFVYSGPLTGVRIVGRTDFVVAGWVVLGEVICQALCAGSPIVAKSAWCIAVS